MSISSDTENRIISAANTLYLESGSERFPTVDAVRRAARADMNTTTLVMKSWRRQQTAVPETVRSTVPDSLRSSWLEHHESALVDLWESAQAEANQHLETAQAAWDVERTEAETMRAELSSAFEDQAVELERITGEWDAAVKRAETAEADAQEIQTALNTVEQQAVHQQAKSESLESRLSDAQDAQKSAEVREKTAFDNAQAQEKISAELRAKMADVEQRITAAETQATERSAALKNAEQNYNKVISEMKADWQNRLDTVEKKAAEDVSELRVTLNNVRELLLESEKMGIKHSTNNDSLKERIEQLEQENSKIKNQQTKHSKK